MFLWKYFIIFVFIYPIYAQMPVYRNPIVPANYGTVRGNQQLMYLPIQLQMQQLRMARAGGIPFKSDELQSRTTLGVPVSLIAGPQAPYGLDIQTVSHPYLGTDTIKQNEYNMANNPTFARKNRFNFTVTSNGEGSINVALRPVDSLPDFIANASNKTIEEFKRIIRQLNTTDEQKLEQIGGLVKNLDETAQKRFRLFLLASPMTAKLLENSASNPTIPTSFKGINAHRRKPVNFFTVPSSFDEITEIINDETLPEKERWRRIVEIYTELEPNLTSEYKVRFIN